MALTETLTDTFVTKDVGKWTWAGTADAVAGRLVIPPSSGSISSASTYDFRESYIYAELVQVGTAASGRYSPFRITSIADGNDHLEMLVNPSGNLFFRQVINGTASPADTSITYSATDHRFLRFRHSGSTLYFDTSPNGITWTNRRTVAQGSIDLSDVRIFFYGTGTTPSVSEIWDNVNTPLTKTTALVDNFASKDTAKWNWFGTAGVSGGKLNLPPTASGDYIQSRDLYDFTESSIHATLVQTGAATGGIYAPFRIPSSVDTNDYLEMLVDGSNNLKFRQVINGTPSDTSVTYNGTTHKHWRISHSGGTLYYDTSTDGVSWTNRRTVAQGAIDLTAVRVEIYSLKLGGTASQDTQWDDFNTIWGVGAASMQRALFGGSGSANSGVMGAAMRSATATAAASHGQTGIVSSALQPLLGSLAGEQGIPGSIAAELANALFAGSGEQIFTGTIGAATQPATATLSGEMLVLGILSTMQPTTVDMVGDQTQTGAIASSFTIIVATITGESIFNEGTLGAEIQPAAFDSSGIFINQGTMGPRLQRTIANMVGLEHFIGTIGATLQRLTLAGVLQLDIFSTGTVYTLKGLTNHIPGIEGPDRMPDILQGRFSAAPYTRTSIPYPASIASNSIDVGVAMLNNAIRLTPPPIIVLGHSQGAQVCSRWMRTYAADGTAPDASELMFILTGNPLRATGGYIIGRQEVGGATGLPTPTDTPWNIVDIARRYDGWADQPNVNVSLAFQNANAGKTTYHKAYEDVDISASTNTSWVIGNTTFVLTQEEPPLTRNMNVPAAVKSAVKRKVEQAYVWPTRPPTDPPVVVPSPSSFWGMVLQFLGIS